MQTPEQEAAWLATLPPPDAVYALALMAHVVTVSARGQYQTAPPDDHFFAPSHFNERAHRPTGFILRIRSRCTPYHHRDRATNRRPHAVSAAPCRLAVAAVLALGSLFIPACRRQPQSASVPLVGVPLGNTTPPGGAVLRYRTDGTAVILLVMDSPYKAGNGDLEQWVASERARQRGTLRSSPPWIDWVVATTEDWDSAGGPILAFGDARSGRKYYAEGTAQEQSTRFSSHGLDPTLLAMRSFSPDGEWVAYLFAAKVTHSQGSLVPESAHIEYEGPFSILVLGDPTTKPWYLGKLTDSEQMRNPRTLDWSQDSHFLLITSGESDEAPTYSGAWVAPNPSLVAIPQSTKSLSNGK